MERTGRKIGVNCGTVCALKFLETFMRKRSIFCIGIPLWTQFQSCRLKWSLISIESYWFPVTALADDFTSHNIQSQLREDYHICQVLTITHVYRIIKHTVCPHSDPQIDDLMCWRFCNYILCNQLMTSYITNWKPTKKLCACASNFQL